MEQQQTASIRMFGVFHTLRRERGLPPGIDMPIARSGRTALEIAGDLNLPLEMIGAVYCNHAPAELGRTIRPGDRIAFVPKGVPGPHNGLQGFPDLETGGPGMPLPAGPAQAQLPGLGIGAKLI